MSLTVITGRHTSLIATNTMSAICPNLLAWLFSNERFAEALASLSGVFPSSSWDSAFAVAYHPGFACNLTCSYCYQKHESLKEQKRIWKPTIHKKDICDKREIANFIFAEMNRARMKQIDLSLLGGEPLMYLDDIGDFVKELRALIQIRSVSVITNGTLIYLPIRCRYSIKLAVMKYRLRLMVILIFIINSEKIGVAEERIVK